MPIQLTTFQLYRRQNIEDLYHKLRLKSSWYKINITAYASTQNSVTFHLLDSNHHHRLTLRMSIFPSQLYILFLLLDYFQIMFDTSYAHAFLLIRYSRSILQTLHLSSATYFGSYFFGTTGGLCSEVGFKKGYENASRVEV